MKFTLVLLFLTGCSLFSPASPSSTPVSSLEAMETATPESAIQEIPSEPLAETGTSLPAPTDTPPPSETPTRTPLPEPTATPTEVPGAGRTGAILRDVTYCAPDGEPQRLDLYFPPNDQTPDPVVVYVHGGGLTSGDKSFGAGFEDLSPLVSAGFVVASINYRLFPPNTFPAQLYDAQCAVRFLRANAGFYNLDSQHFGIYGTSAGGYIASMLGLTQPGDGFDDEGEYPGFSYSVQAVVSLFGISTLFPEADPNGNSAWGPITPETAPRFSATTYATANDPPLLLIHGDKDQTVPLVQSQLLYDALTNAGGQATFIVVRNGLHGLEAGSAEMEPNRSLISQRIVQFFADYLR